MTLSKERLEEKLLEHIKHGGDCEEEDMIRELLERRERDKQEPVGYAFFSEVELMLTNRMVGGMLTVRKIGECPLYAAPPAPDDSAIFNAAIDRCRTDDVIDERAWNYGILRVITHYENCRSTMLNGGQS